MQQRQAFKYSILAGWFIAALAIVLVAPLLVPEDSRSDYFWYRVVWAEMLNLLFWGSASFYILVSATQKDAVTRLGAIAPTISVVTAAYAIMSFSVMTVHALLSSGDIASRIHWILQILLFAVAALSVVFLSISRAASTSGLAFDRTRATTPKELHDLLVAQESFLTSPESRGLRSGIKQLRELLAYSLCESSSLAELPAYQELSSEIRSLCMSLTNLSDGGEGKLKALQETIAKLATKAKAISTQQIRR